MNSYLKKIPNLERKSFLECNKLNTVKIKCIMFSYRLVKVFLPSLLILFLDVPSNLAKIIMEQVERIICMDCFMLAYY